MLDYITAEWYDLAPELLGSLRPIVRDLPPGRTLPDFYPSPMGGPSVDTSPSASSRRSVPSPLFEVFAIRAVLREAWSVPGDCAESIFMAAQTVSGARENYRRNYGARREVRNAARLELLAAHATLQSHVMETEFLFMERQVIWDRIVYFLRGNSFFVEDFAFDEEMYIEPDRLWFGVLPAGITRVWPDF
jgi:hypothetical protein